MNQLLSTKNCPSVKQANANNYMKLAKEMPILLTSKSQTSVIIGLSQAIALLSATEEVKTEDLPTLAIEINQADKLATNILIVKVMQRYG